jgi:hypothetical protein
MLGLELAGATWGGKAPEAVLCDSSMGEYLRGALDGRDERRVRAAVGGWQSPLSRRGDEASGVSVLAGGRAVVPLEEPRAQSRP